MAGRPGFGGVGGANTTASTPAPARGPRVAFAVSNYTQIPNAVIDEYMAGLSGAEFKVLAYIARRTFGFHRESARVSVAQLAGGLVGRDGRRLDEGTGLSRAQVFVAVKGLEEKGLVAVRRTGNTGGKSTEANTYTLWVQGAGSENGEPVMGDEWQGAGAPAEGAAVTPPRLEIGRGTPSGNQTPPRLEIGPPYKERKESGKYRPPSPMGNGGGKENGTQPPITACPVCSGYGLLDSGTPACWPHVGTLEAVRYFVQERGAKYCGCAVGQGWRALVEDAAKGDGERKAAGGKGKGAKC